MRLIIIFMLLLLSCSFKGTAQCGGMDILIANDQSGSVDGQENSESRQFITAFAEGFPLGNNAGQYRIAIADWDFGEGWKQFNFPVAGENFTTHFSDIVSYGAAPRVLHTGTSLVMALQKSFAVMQQNTTGRPKVIMILTDAFDSDTQQGLLDLATQVKANGIYIVVMAVNEAMGNAALANVASPGGYFVAESYTTLSENAVAFTNSIAGAACSGTRPAFDLGIRLPSFNAVNCYPGPGVYTLQYEITNFGNLPWNDSVFVSMYDANLQSPSTKPVLVFKTERIQLAPGQTYKGSIVSSSFANFQLLNAIVNFNGNAHPVALPIYPHQLYALLDVAGEKISLNNYSNPINKTNGVGCTPRANLLVDVIPQSATCGNKVKYQVNICNNGNQDTRLWDLLAKPHPSFILEHSDHNIDSASLNVSTTYFGGLLTDYAYSTAADRFGAVYIAGQTNSANAIATPGAYRTNNGSTQDGFLAKFSADGRRIWSTYFGGTGPENIYAVATDRDGNVYITGETGVSPNIATGGAHQLSYGGSYDAYLAKFNANGTIQWSTYYGGSAADYGRSITTDKDGNVYIAGNTASATAIATTGAHQTTLGGGVDAFLIKFNDQGQRLWGTYYGGSGTESGFGVITDTDNNVYLTGLSASTNNISTAGTHQTTKGIGNDAYLVKFNSNGQRMWGTYFGGNASDICTAIAIDAQDKIYIAGNTSSTTGIGMAGAHQPASNGNTEAFIAKFNGIGNVEWSTYYGGTGVENGRNLVVAADDYLYLSGNTTSTTAIATADGFQPVYAGDTDAFVAKFDKDGQRIWGTYYGGDKPDITSALVTDALGKIYMTGATQSTGMATAGSHQPNYGGGGNDAFLMTLDQVSSFVLRAGKCVTLNYYYDVSNAPAGNYDFSFSLKTVKLFASDETAVIHPDTSGFIGENHLTENIVLANQTAACLPGPKLTTAIVIPNNTVCGITGYTPATITIENNSGMVISNAFLELSLSGSQVNFASELYGAGNGFHYAQPDISNVNYPLSPNALLNKNGSIRIPVFTINPGISNINIDVSTASNDLLLTAKVTGLSIFITPSAESNLAQSSGSITVAALPLIDGWNPPATININQSVLLSGISTQMVSHLKWISATAGSINGQGTLTQPALQYQPSAIDIANGYFNLTLTTYNTHGCDVSKIAYIKINGVEYDYGDAPTSYDLQQNKTPVAAAATLLDGIHLGKIKPGADAQTKPSVNAIADGLEEDGLADKCPAKPLPGNEYILNCTVTNNSNKAAYISGYIDWNNDGDFMDEGERTIQPYKVNAQSGTVNQLLYFNTPAVIAASSYMIRLRLSTDSAAITKPYAPAAEGETEDHLLILREANITRQNISICKGDSFSVGNNIYYNAGYYSDTLINEFGCDSIVQTTLSIEDCGACEPMMPTAFTPNNDGLNDYFAAFMRCIPSRFKLSLFNRWGEKIFETDKLSGKWDGRVNGLMQSTAVFIWQCDYETDGVYKTKKGTVMLIK